VVKIRKNASLKSVAQVAVKRANAAAKRYAKTLREHNEARYSDDYQTRAEACRFDNHWERATSAASALYRERAEMAWHLARLAELEEGPLDWSGEPWHPNKA
jgi:hypothetical protein